MYQLAEPRFSLDRDAALAAIAQTWGLRQSVPSEWRLDRFGPTLGSSLENLAGVVFSPGRSIVSGPPGEVRVFALPDDHSTPVLVCVGAGEGPMLCTGIEDFGSAFADPWGASPDLVLAALDRILDVASATIGRCATEATQTTQVVADAGSASEPATSVT